jgi:hypothetical protein
LGEDDFNGIIDTGRIREGGQLLGHNGPDRFIDSGQQVSSVPDLDEIEFVSSPHEVDNVAGSNDPAEFATPGIHNREPAEPASGHLLNRPNTSTASYDS